MSATKKTTWLCPHCNLSFDLDDDAAIRCPKCMRKSGLSPLSLLADEGPVLAHPARFGGRRVVVLTLLVGAVVAGLIVFLTQRHDGATKPGATAGDDGLARDVAAAEVAPDAVPAWLTTGEAVTALATPLNADGADDRARAEALLESVRGLTRGSALKLEAFGDRPPAREPATAEALAKAAQGGAGAANPWEMAALFYAMCRARGIDATLAERTTTRNAATSIRTKELGVLVGPPADARFLDPWNGVTDAGSSARTLTPGQFAAYGLGLRALWAEARGDKAAAAEDAANAMKLFPDSPAMLFLKGQLEMGAGGAEIGLQSMEKAVAAAPDGLGWYNLGAAYARNESSFKAYQAFHKAVEVDPRYAPGWLALGNMELQRVAQVPEDQVEERLKAAEDAFAKAREADPNVAGLAVSEAQLLLMRDKPEEAQARLRKALEEQPKEPDPKLMLGQMLFDEGKSAEGLDLIEEAALLAPERAELRQMLGGAFATTQDWKRAVDTWRRLLAAAPAARDVRLHLATALRESGDKAGARAMLDEQVKQFPDDTLSKSLLAQLLVDAHELEPAITLLREVAAKEPGPEGRILLFYALSQAGKADEAAKVLDEIAAKHEEGRQVTAQVLLEQGAVPLAIEVLQGSLEKDPQDHQAAVMLATALRATGKTEEAQKVREEAVARAPEDQRKGLEGEFDEAFHQIDAMMKPQGDGSGATPPPAGGPTDAPGDAP